MRIIFAFFIIIILLIIFMPKIFTIIGEKAEKKIESIKNQMKK